MERGETLRSKVTTSATFASGSPTSNVIPLPHHVPGAGIAWLPSGFTGFALGIQAGPSAGGVAGGGVSDLSNAYGTDVSVTLPTAQLATAKTVILPSYWFAAPFFSLFAHDGTGSGMPQTSARVVVVSFAS